MRRFFASLRMTAKEQELRSGAVRDYEQPLDRLRYARIVAAWQAAELLDLSQPLYLHEIGVGNGRFGYLFLRQLLESLDSWSCPVPAIRDLYTDVPSTTSTCCARTLAPAPDCERPGRLYRLRRARKRPDAADPEWRRASSMEVFELVVVLAN